MKFSHNSETSILEVYSDDCVYQGNYHYVSLWETKSVNSHLAGAVFLLTGSLARS